MEKCEKAIELIKNYEGFSNKFYFCPAGLKTIGWGHVILKNENIPNVITNEMAEEILISDAFIVLEVKARQGIVLSIKNNWPNYMPYRIKT